MTSHIKNIFFIIIIVVLGALPTFLQYGDYLFFSDYLNQQIPFIIETRRILSSGCPLWSWNTFLGQNFIGAYSFYTLTSPFVWFNCLFPEQWIIKSIFFTLILKYIAAYFTSYLYFRKMDISKDNSILGGILYAFSSYAITNLYYYHFFEPLIVFPLLLIALERFFRNERYGMSVLIITSFLVTFINYYFSICSFIAAAIYSLCRLYDRSIKISISRIFICISCVILGILLDSAILFPSIIKVTGTSRISEIKTGFNYTWIWVAIERLRNFVMPQIIEGGHSVFRYTGYGSTSLCIPVFGAFLAILFCIKNPKNWMTLLFIVLAIFYITPFNNVFSLFTAENYTRWGYTLCLFIIMLSIKYLDLYGNVKVKHLLLYSCASAILCAFAIHQHGIEADNESRSVILYSYLSIFALNLICLSHWIIYRKKSVLYLSILICVTSQMCLFHTLTTDVYRDYVKKAHGIKNNSELNSTKKNIARNLKNKHLPKLDGDMHYRSIFYGGMMNSGMINNRACDISMHSVFNFQAARFYATSDTIWHPEAMTFHNCNFRSYYALTSVKDFIVYDDFKEDFISSQLKTSLQSNNHGYSIYTSDDYIPMGFTYDNYILESVVDSINNITPKQDVPLLLLNNLAICENEKSLFSKYLKQGDITSDNNIDSIIIARKKECSKTFAGTTEGFISEIKLSRDNFVFFSVPYDRGFTAYVDSLEVPIHEVNLGLSAIQVPKGKHKIEFKFIPEGLIPGVYVSVGILGLLVLLVYIEKNNIYKNIVK